MTLVVDASVVIAGILDTERHAGWAEQQLTTGLLAAPHLMPVEAAAFFRRASLSGNATREAASWAHDQLVALRVELFPYAGLADRIWELRETVTAYDAWYVALAEALDAPLATLDARLARATGPRCRFALPPDT